MLKKYATEAEGDRWSVIDTTLRDDSNSVYEELAEFEALTIAEILNSNEADMTFDQVCADWRWAVLLKIEALEARE